jgi:hypothetical protein
MRCSIHHIYGSTAVRLNTAWRSVYICGTGKLVIVRISFLKIWGIGLALEVPCGRVMKIKIEHRVEVDLTKATIVHNIGIELTITLNVRKKASKRKI